MNYFGSDKKLYRIKRLIEYIFTYIHTYIRYALIFLRLFPFNHEFVIAINITEIYFVVYIFNEN